MLTLSHAAHLTAVAAEGFVRDFRFRAHAVAREHVPTALQVVANHYRPLSVADHHLSFLSRMGGISRIGFGHSSPVCCVTPMIQSD